MFLYINIAGSSLSEIDNVSSGEDELTTRALLVKVNARLDTFTRLTNLCTLRMLTSIMFSLNAMKILEEVKSFKLF